MTTTKEKLIEVLRSHGMPPDVLRAAERMSTDDLLGVLLEDEGFASAFLEAAHLSGSKLERAGDVWVLTEPNGAVHTSFHLAQVLAEGGCPL